MAYQKTMTILRLKAARKRRVNTTINMPSLEFAYPQEEPKRRRPELKIVPPSPSEEQEIGSDQILEERELTPFEVANARVEQLRAKLAEAEDQLKIEETREVIGKNGAPAEEEFFKKGDTPGALEEN